MEAIAQGGKMEGRMGGRMGGWNRRRKGMRDEGERGSEGTDEQATTAQQVDSRSRYGVCGQVEAEAVGLPECISIWCGGPSADYFRKGGHKLANRTPRSCPPPLRDLVNTPSRSGSCLQDLVHQILKPVVSTSRGGRRGSLGAPDSQQVLR